MHQTRRRILTALGTTALGALAGCIGSTDGTTDTETPLPNTETPAWAEPAEMTPTATLTPTDTPEMTPTATPTGSVPAPDQTGKLTPDDGATDDGFGGAVAVAGDGTTALIGASSDEDPNGEKAGAAYVFE